MQVCILIVFQFKELNGVFRFKTRVNRVKEEDLHVSATLQLTCIKVLHLLLVLNDLVYQYGLIQCRYRHLVSAPVTVIIVKEHMHVWRLEQHPAKLASRSIFEMYGHIDGFIGRKINFYLLIQPRSSGTNLFKPGIYLRITPFFQ